MITIVLNTDTPITNIKKCYVLDKKYYVAYTDNWVTVVDEKHQDVVKFNKHNVIAIYRDK